MAQAVEVGDTVMLHPMTPRPEDAKDNTTSAMVVELVGGSLGQTMAVLADPLYGIDYWPADDLVVVQKG